MTTFIREKLLGQKPRQLEEADPYGYDIYQYKVRFSLVGPVNAGKSSLAAAIVVAAETMSATIRDFYCRVLPKSSHILTDANNLRLGRFPEKTDPYLPVAPEAGLLIGERYGKKTLQIPICDVGGEVVDALAIAYPTIDQLERIRNINRQVINHIRESQGFILTLPATDALMFRKDHRAMDADSYLYTVLSQVMDFKLYTRTSIEGIAVWLTKWDEAMDDAKDLGMDVYTDSMGMARFMANGFPALNMLLKPLIDAGKVQFFRSFFQLKKRDDGTTPELWPDGRKKIEVIDDPRSFIRKKPLFAEQDCVNFIKWVGSFAK